MMERGIGGDAGMGVVFMFNVFNLTSYGKGHE